MEIKVAACAHPTCENISTHVDIGIELCNSCLKTTIIRFMMAEGTYSEGEFSEYQLSRAAHWAKFIRDNLDDLLEAERKAVEKYGADYDRD